MTKGASCYYKMRWLLILQIVEIFITNSVSPFITKQKPLLWKETSISNGTKIRQLLECGAFITQRIFDNFYNIF